VTGRRFTLEAAAVAFLVAEMSLRVSAQTDQFVPEIDAYYKLTPDVRLSLVPEFDLRWLLKSVGRTSC
jgi:hypothetical protein